jgi:hypothetical protein
MLPETLRGLVYFAILIFDVVALPLGEFSEVDWEMQAGGIVAPSPLEPQKTGRDRRDHDFALVLFWNDIAVTCPLNQKRSN